MDYFGGRALGSSSGRSLSDLDNTDVVDDDAEEDEDANDEAEEGGVSVRNVQGSSKSDRRNATSSGTEEGDEGTNRSFLSGWTKIFEGGRRSWWIDTAASGFHFVLDAIDKMPQ